MTTSMSAKRLMNKQVLLDTNILTYAIDEDSKYFEVVRGLLNDNSFEFCTTFKNLSEFLSVVTRAPNASMSVQDALQAVEDFRSYLKILYPTEESLDLFVDLVRRYSPGGLKIHGHEIASIALSNKIPLIATLNKKDFAGIEEITLVPIG